MTRRSNQLALVGCSLLLQIVGRQQIDRQSQARSSLFHSSMIIRNPYSSIKTMLTFTKSRVANLEAFKAPAWLPRTTRFPPDSMLKWSIWGKHSVKGIIATLPMAIQRLRASSMRSFNNNTSMTLTRLLHRLITALWLLRTIIQGLATWNSEEDIKASGLKLLKCHWANIRMLAIWMRQRTRWIRLASSITGGHNRIRELLLSRVRTRWPRPPTSCHSQLDWIRLPSREPLVDPKEHQMDLPSNKVLILRGKVLQIKRLDLQEKLVKLHVTQPFRTQARQPIKVKPWHWPFWTLIRQMVQPEPYTIKVSVKGQISARMALPL